MINKKNILAAVAASLAFAGVAHAIPTQDYVKMAGAGDLYEKKSSEMVMASTKDAHVKMIAKTMIADHTKSTNMVKAAATKSGLHPMPPMLEPKQQAMIDDLMKAHGADRDMMYIKQQKMAHEEALALHSGYANDGQNPELRMVAGKIAPVVKHHIEMLNTAGM